MCFKSRSRRRIAADDGGGGGCCRCISINHSVCAAERPASGSTVARKFLLMQRKVAAYRPVLSESLC
jgi:hypothetical protein